MKFRIGDMVTPNELANSLNGPVMLYGDPPLIWKDDVIIETGCLQLGRAATVLATYHNDGLSVYLMGEGCMGWALSAYLKRIVDNPIYHGLG